MHVGERYEDITNAFSSIRDDAKSMVTQLDDGKIRNMWFVKPGLRKPVPISPRQKLSGGAANGDIASTNYAGDYKAQYVSDERVGETDCYLFDLLSNTRKATYYRIRYWIN